MVWLHNNWLECPGYKVRIPDNKVHGANMGPTWVLSAPDGPHVSLSGMVVKYIDILMYISVSDNLFTCVLMCDSQAQRQSSDCPNIGVKPQEYPW